MMVNEALRQDLVLGEQLKSFFLRLSARPLPLDVLEMIEQLEASNATDEARLLADVPS